MDYNSLMIEPDLVLHLTDKVTIPEACRDCPMLADLSRIHDRLTQRAAQLADLAVSGAAEAEFGRLVEGSNASEAVNRIPAESYKDGLRQVTIAMVDSMYEDADRAVRMAEGAINDCVPEGTLTMRARRSGKQIVATFCMSASMERATESTGIINESVAVKRTDVEP